MPISSTLWSMWGVVLQKRGVFFLHSRRVSRGWGKGEEGGKRERYCESAVLQKRGVIFQQNGIGEKEKRDGRERESEMRKKRVKVSLTRIRMLGPFWYSNGSN